MLPGYPVLFFFVIEQKEVSVRRRGTLEFLQATIRFFPLTKISQFSPYFSPFIALEFASVDYDSAQFCWFLVL